MVELTQKVAKGKKVIVETGWPSVGRKHLSHPAQTL
jgi:exo-beta-1,3-glucanase (GH17 family)